MIILTHRGLDPAKGGYFAESSREAFADHLARGFGLEFDVRVTKEGEYIVLHDSDLRRLTGGRDARKIEEVSIRELLEMSVAGCHLVSFRDLLRMIARQSENLSIHALHIKSGLQKPEYLRAIAKELRKADRERFVLFDLNIEAARYLKDRDEHLHLAPSLAHPYDILRYNQFVGGTLLPLETVIEQRAVYDWVWLDEWDRTDKDGGAKSLYDKETFARLRKAGFNIALVTPELHATSPGLLGGEAHQDAATKATLQKRFKEIVALRPDAICTDYPESMRALL